MLVQHRQCKIALLHGFLKLRHTSPLPAHLEACGKRSPSAPAGTTLQSDLTFQDGQFCPKSQPRWSAFRDPSFGHGEAKLPAAGGGY